MRRFKLGNRFVLCALYHWPRVEKCSHPPVATITDAAPVVALVGGGWLLRRPPVGDRCGSHCGRNKEMTKARRKNSSGSRKRRMLPTRPRGGDRARNHGETVFCCYGGLALQAGVC